MAALTTQTLALGSGAAVFAKFSPNSDVYQPSKLSTSFFRKNTFSMSRSGIIGTPLSLDTNFSRTNSRRIVCAAVLASVKGSRDELLRDLQQRLTKIEKFPLEGVPFSFQEFEEAISKFDFNYNIGEKVKGVIFKADAHGALVDIGAKAPAFLPIAESSLYKVKSLDEVGIYPGLQEEFYIIDEDDENGRMILSLRKIHYEFAWERCQQLLTDDVTCRGRVIDVNKGGVLVEVEGLRGFVPASQVATRSPRETLVNRYISLKFMEVDEERNRLVMSNRKAMAESQVASFGVGDVVVGTVQSVKPYGAFIDVGGINGLLHISQISHDRLTNVETVLQEGDKLKVMVLSHDRDRGRISFSTKKLEPTPGDMLRNPALVYEKAEEMADLFRERVAQAEAAARAEDQQGLLQASMLGFRGVSADEPSFDLSGL